MSLIKRILIISLIVLMIILFQINISKAATVEITTETLNLRKEATTESDIVAQISIGEECELLGEEGDWYRVQYNDYTGYISKEYAEVVSDGEPETTSGETNTEANENTTANETTEPSENTTIDDNTEPSGDNNTTSEPQGSNNNTTASNTEGRLNRAVDLRIVPLINGGRIERLRNNTSVTVIEVLNGWSYVQTDTLSGWVRSDAITIQASQNNDNSNDNSGDTDNNTDNNTDTNSDNHNNTSDFEERTMYATDYINIRQEPNTSSERIMTVAPNTELTVVGESGDWYEVETSEGNAYVLKELLSTSRVEVTNRGNVDRTTDNDSKEEAETQEEVSTSDVSESTNKQNTDNENTDKKETSNSSTTAKEIVAYAKKFLGVPYVYGGASPSGFDCSGFTMYVYDHFGISMRHGAQAQAKLGEVVNADKSSKSSLLNNLEVGDLVFFLDYETMDEIGHCGIYIGNGEFIHASSGSGYCVKINSLLPGEYYNTRYCAARRVI